MLAICEAKHSTLLNCFILKNGQPFNITEPRNLGRSFNKIFGVSEVALRIIGFKYLVCDALFIFS